MASLDLGRMKRAALAAGGLEWTAVKEDCRRIVASDGRPCAAVIGGGHARPYTATEMFGISDHLVASNPAAVIKLINQIENGAPVHPFEIAVRCAANLRGYRLHAMPGGFFAVYRKDHDMVIPITAWITLKDVARLFCKATHKITLRDAAERDGLVWPVEGCLDMAIENDE